MQPREDFWEHQFDDGSLETNTHKATLFGLSKMRQDLSRRSRYLEVKKTVWWSLGRNDSSSSNPGLSEASTDAPEGESVEGVEGPQAGEGARGDGGDRLEELTRKVQALEAQISLLTVGALRNSQAGDPNTFEDICGRGLRTKACIPPEPETQEKAV